MGLGAANTPWWDRLLLLGTGLLIPTLVIAAAVRLWDLLIGLLAWALPGLAGAEPVRGRPMRGGTALRVVLSALGGAGTVWLLELVRPEPAALAWLVLAAGPAAVALALSAPGFRPEAYTANGLAAVSACTLTAGVWQATDAYDSPWYVVFVFTSLAVGAFTFPGVFLAGAVLAAVHQRRAPRTQ